MTKSPKSAGKPAALITESASPDNVSEAPVEPTVNTGSTREKSAKTVAKTAKMGAIREMLYFAFRNRKLIIGLSIVSFFLLLAIVGPYLAQHGTHEYGNPTMHAPTLKGGLYMGTTSDGLDVYAQFVNGLRLAFIVGLIGGGIASIIGMVVGFTAGYKAGLTDELLNMLTNVVLCIPVFALLLVIAAFMKIKGVIPEALLIGFVNWPWAARALRAQTFSLTSREFVSLARLSGCKTWKIIFKEIAPNMSSYLFMMFILLFGGAILTAATLDFIGLGPSGTISLGQMMNQANQNASLLLGFWWWFIPPGLAMTLIVGGAYFMNVGLDEVFNPRLREM
jgi:peptide/nickel transport system permease protein